MIRVQWHDGERKPASAIIFASGLSFSTAVLCASICACASAIVAPGFKRAIICVPPPPEWRCCGVRSSNLVLIGRKSRASEERNRKSGGNTPTIFLGRPFTRISRPRTFGSELRRCAPEAVGQDGDSVLFLSPPRFRFGERATHRKIDAKRREKFRRDAHDLFLLGRTGIADGFAESRRWKDSRSAGMLPRRS